MNNIINDNNTYYNNYYNNNHINNNNNINNNNYNNNDNNYNNYNNNDINNNYNNVNNNNYNNNYNNNNDINNDNNINNDIKEFIGYKKKNIDTTNNKYHDWCECKTCKLMHPSKYFIKTKEYCYNCWGWKSLYNFDLEYGKYVTSDNTVTFNEALDIIENVLIFYDNIGNEQKITDSIFTKFLHYSELGLLHPQYAKILYRKKELTYIGNKNNIKIDYKKAYISI